MIGALVSYQWSHNYHDTLYKSLLTSLYQREELPLFGRRPMGPPSGA